MSNPCQSEGLCYLGCPNLFVLNTLRPRQNERHFADDIFKCIFLNENVCISIKISLKLFPRGQINNIPALIEIISWCRPGDKPLSEPMVFRLPTPICVPRRQWVKPVCWPAFHLPASLTGLHTHHCHVTSSKMRRCSVFYWQWLWVVSRPRRLRDGVGSPQGTSGSLGCSPQDPHWNEKGIN